MSEAWDPRQYERFRDERAQPFFDLLAMVLPRPGMRAVDLGCGTGELTAHLHRTLACASTLGIDSSAAMLAAVPRDVPHLQFQLSDIETFDAAGARFDLVFSNAAVHWVPDHPRLFARLTALATDAGQIAVQMPANFDHPSHATAAEVAAELPFAGALAGWQREVPVLAPEAYTDLLDKLGWRDIHVRLQVYAHHLDSREHVVEWVKGTLLTDYKKRLAPDLYARFLDEYRARLIPRLEDRRPYLYTYKRILMHATRRQATG